MVWMLQDIDDEDRCMLPHQLLQLLPLTRSEGPALAIDHLPCHVSVDEVPQRLFRTERCYRGREGGYVCMYLSMQMNAADSVKWK
jgi:hypothetical protein